MSATLADPQSILAFWFGDPALFNTVPHITTQMERWFMNKDPTVEVSFNEARDMIELLGQDEGLGEEWLTPKGTLARIVMLDQGSRTVFRATTQAFTHDPTALRLSLDGSRLVPAECRQPRRRSADVQGHARLFGGSLRSDRAVRPIPFPQRGPGSRVHSGGGGVAELPRHPRLGQVPDEVEK
mmetsp:Transcript_21568/g.48273  ORF Transcript_21568/g.48273 Transcript_21568/m.48273 type:complete len:183 (-) Transcript_21568:244-792(-)